MADTKQPTILIKKSDGTKVRVTLEEFKKMRAGEVRKEESGMANEEKLSEVPSVLTSNPSVTLVKDTPVIEENELATTTPVVKVFINEAISNVEKEKDAPVAEENELATTTPVADIFVNAAAANFEWDQKDKKSLMDEDLTEVEDLKKKGAVHVGQHDLEEHIKMPGVEIEEDLRNRAKSLVISWKKGIRNEFQLLDYATKDVNHGGLGLSEEQAQRFFEKVKDSRTNLDNLFEIVFEKKAKIENVIEEKRIEENKVVAFSNSNSVVKEGIIPVAKTPFIPIEKEDNYSFNQPYSHTPPSSTFHDVALPQTNSRTTGPKQEIADFSVVDYRRLARDPKKCADMLLAKFNAWKKESFMLFLDTMDGWHKSSLFRMYVQTTVESINNKLTIAQVLQSKDPSNFITLEEYESIISVDSSLLN
jgi:hypothetical protein